MQDLPAQIRQAIDGRGLSQAEIALRCGVSQPTISRIIESGIGRTGPAVRKIMDAVAAGALDNNYSSLPGGRDRICAHLDHILEMNPSDGDALENLIEAIARFSAALRNGG